MNSGNWRAPEKFPQATALLLLWNTTYSFWAKLKQSPFIILQQNKTLEIKKSQLSEGRPVSYIVVTERDRGVELKATENKSIYWHSGDLQTPETAKTYYFTFALHISLTFYHKFIIIGHFFFCFIGCPCPWCSCW